MQNTDKTKKLEGKINSIAQEIFDLHEDVGYRIEIVEETSGYTEEERRKNKIKHEIYHFTGSQSDKFWNLFGKLSNYLLDWVNARGGKLYLENDIEVENKKQAYFSHNEEMFFCACKTIVDYDPHKFPNLSYIAYFSNQLYYFILSAKNEEDSSNNKSGIKIEEREKRNLKKLYRLAKSYNKSLKDHDFKSLAMHHFNMDEKYVNELIDIYNNTYTVSADENNRVSKDGVVNSIVDFISDTRNGINPSDQFAYKNLETIYLIMNKINSFWKESRKGTEDRVSLVCTYWVLKQAGNMIQFDLKSLAQKYNFFHKPLLADFAKENKLPMKKDLEKYDSAIQYKYSKFEEALLEYLKKDEELKSLVDVNNT